MFTSYQCIHRTHEMTSDASAKGGKLCIVITHKIVWANQKTESLVYGWLRTLAMFDITCFPAHVRALCHFKHSVDVLLIAKVQSPGKAKKNLVFRATVFKSLGRVGCCFFSCYFLRIETLIIKTSTTKPVFSKKSLRSAGSR